MMESQLHLLEIPIILPKGDSDLFGRKRVYKD